MRGVRFTSHTFVAFAPHSQPKILLFENGIFRILGQRKHIVVPFITVFFRPKFPSWCFCSKKRNTCYNSFLHQYLLKISYFCALHSIRDNIKRPFSTSSLTSGLWICLSLKSWLLYHRFGDILQCYKIQTNAHCDTLFTFNCKTTQYQICSYLFVVFQNFFHPGRLHASHLMRRRFIFIWKLAD